MSTLQQVSHFCKMASPFLAAILSLIVAYEDRHKRRKFALSLFAAMFFLTIGYLLVFVE
jgi:hypothetical protein